MTTFTPARSPSAAIRRVASRPSTPGIRMSIKITSGRSARARSTRLLPVDRLADHLDVRGRLEQHPEAGADQRLVVGQQRPGSPAAALWPLAAESSRVGGRASGAVLGLGVNVKREVGGDPETAGRAAGRSR